MLDFIHRLLTPPTYQGRRRSILVADDQADNLQVLRGMLEPLGFNILQAKDGWQAIEVAQRHKPDLILIDLSMPMMDGFAATEVIRQKPDLAQMVVIAVSAKVFAADQIRSRAAGCNAFLPKPIDENALLALLSDFLHLDWIYKKVTNRPSVDQLVLPPRAELEILYELSLMGKMIRIQERADYLFQLGEQFIPFAEHLRTLAQDFEDEKITTLVQEAIDRTG